MNKTTIEKFYSHIEALKEMDSDRRAVMVESMFLMEQILKQTIDYFMAVKFGEINPNNRLKGSFDISLLDDVFYSTDLTYCSIEMEKLSKRLDQVSVDFKISRTDFSKFDPSIWN